jgi:hypothetical protein
VHIEVDGGPGGACHAPVLPGLPSLHKGCDSPVE